MTVSQYDYENDPLGRRTLRADSGSAFGVAITNDFGYNIRSEVESALMGTNQYGYVFDPIGNRLRSNRNAVTNLYAANSLNQYTNVLAAMPPRDDTPVYDEDGNILRLRDWTLEWDGENRLVLASNATVTVRYAHDFMGRRVWRAADGVTNRFDYDGWALIRERTESGGTVVTNNYFYGPDLSGSMQGAGTIGGLWLRTGPDGTAAFTYDGNGNVSELVGPAGAIRAHYEYDAFGNVTAQSGDLAAANPFRFSTKRQDEATGLLYYGYRDLDTVWGRWMSRDPIGEEGGHNLLGFVRNGPLQKQDLLGLASWLEDSIRAMDEQNRRRAIATPLTEQKQKPRDYSCCTPAVLDKGLEEMRNSYAEIFAIMKGEGIKHRGKGDSDNCSEVNLRVKMHMETVNVIPDCWTCALEERFREPLLYCIGQPRDHWGFVCRGYGTRGKVVRQVLFDYWRPRPAGEDTSVWFDLRWHTPGPNPPSFPPPSLPPCRGTGGGR